MSEFSDYSLTKKSFCYEALVQCEDPEELRSFLKDCFNDGGFQVIVDKVGENDDDLVRRLLKWKGVKVFHSRTKMVQKLRGQKVFIKLSQTLLLLSFIMMALANIFHSLVFSVSAVSLIILSIFFFFYKKSYASTVWVKTSGIYSPGRSTGFAKIFVAGGSAEPASLESLLNKIYRLALSKYARSSPLKVPLVDGSVEKLEKEISEVNDDLNSLSKKFRDGGVGEKVFDDEKEELRRKRECLKDLQDLIY